VAMLEREVRTLLQERLGGGIQVGRASHQLGNGGRETLQDAPSRAAGRLRLLRNFDLTRLLPVLGETAAHDSVELGRFLREGLAIRRHPLFPGTVLRLAAFAELPEL